MKKDIHPEYTMMNVRLADGTEMQTRSTMGIEQYNSDVDATNHPFYTGKKQMLDTAGRVEKFRRRYGARNQSEAEKEAEQEAAAEQA
jgi:large subunit ribosomal protein L31